jgi:phosphoadenosine phosphosulfate reductase
LQSYFKNCWETDTAQGLILINLVDENPQMKWYVEKFDVGRAYARQTVEDMLTAVGVKPKDAKSIVNSYKRLVETPLGTSLHWDLSPKTATSSAQNAR